MLMIQGSPINGNLYLEELKTDAGFAEINIGRARVVCRYNFIVHTINIMELNELVQKSRETIELLGDTEYSRMAKDEISEMENMLHMLKPHRKRRGLINAGGSVLKFIWGTMDDDDRKLIEEHQKVIDENNHQLIQRSNQQILINGAFNKSITNLRNAIVFDRKIVEEQTKRLGTLNKEFVNNGLGVTQLFKVQHLKHKIRDIADQIANAKIGLFSPALLSPEEVEVFGIDIETLKNMKTLLVEWVDSKISIIIKVPTEIVETTKRFLVPIPDHKHNQIMEEPEIVVDINNKTLKFQPGQSLLELKPSTKCTLNKRCKTIKNAEQRLIEVDSSMAVLINMNHIPFSSTCDQRKLELTGHYFMHFNNCTINIGGTTLGNRIMEKIQTFSMPTQQEMLTTERVLTYQEIMIQQQDNIKTIEELKFNNMINTTTGGVSLFVILGLSGIIVILCKRRANIKVKITDKRISKRRLEADQIRRDITEAESIV